MVDFVLSLNRPFDVSSNIFAIILYINDVIKGGRGLELSKILKSFFLILAQVNPGWIFRQHAASIYGFVRMSVSQFR